MFRSGNPALKVFDKPQTLPGFGTASKTMTVSGTVNASFILVSLCAASAVASWMLLTSKGSNQVALPVILGSLAGGTLTSIIMWISKRSSPVIAPIYAICEGMFLGAISLFAADRFGATAAGAAAGGAGTGMIFQAIILTFGIAFSLLIGYRSGLVRVGSTVKRCMYAACGGIIIYFLAGLLLPYIGVQMPLFYEMFGWGKSGLIGIGFSAFMLVLASLFLVLDFQAIEAGAAMGAPKYMEWYGAYSLLATLVWIYLEALRLLSKLRDR